MNLNDILTLLHSKTNLYPRHSGEGYVARCPAHDDRNPSLSISESPDRKILLKCHAGCDYKDICQRLGIEDKDLFPEKDFDHGYLQRKPKRIEYPYTDEKGDVLFSKVRVEHGYGKPKTFFCERKDSNGNIVKNRTGCRKILYNLQTVLAGIENGETIYLVEGEKDVETLRSHGIIATTTTESSDWSKDYTDVLKNADVVILYDNDKAGLKRKDLIARNLRGKVKKLRIVDLPGIEYKESHGEDITDWLLKDNNSFELFIDIVNKTPEHRSVGNNSKLRTITIDELLALDLPPREMLLSPFLPSQGLVLLVAKRGVGKTHVALGIAYAIASGGTFFHWVAPAPKKVLYIDGEMPAVLMQERLMMIASMFNKKPEPDFLKILTPDLQDEVLPDLSQKEGRKLIEELIADVDLIIIDNISCLFRSGGENEAESWQEAQEWALELRRRGKSILFVHHAGKSGNQRGTSKREDILDTVIILKHADDYKSDEGARFDVIFDKTRHFSGEDARSFQVQLINADGKSWWEVSDISKNDEIIKVAQMKNKGMKIKDIAQETGLTKSQVETRTTKAKEMGLLDD